MTKTMMRLGSALCSWILLLAVAEQPVAAGTKVQVTFSGTNVSSGTPMSGYIEYDQSLPPTSPYVFNFEGSALTHQICYVLGSGACMLYSSWACEPYRITTSGNSGRLFQLYVMAPTSPQTPITIKLATNVTLSRTSLPYCDTTTSTPTHVFQRYPAPGASTFTIIINNVTYTYNLTNILCSQPSEVPAPPAPVVCEYPAPAPCPAYACQPRQACCLFQLFQRRPQRGRCR